MPSKLLLKAPLLHLADGLCVSPGHGVQATYRLKTWLKSPRPYLMVLGLGLFLLTWYLTTEVLKLPRFEKLPCPSSVLKEWISEDPSYGISIYVSEYYLHTVALQALTVLECMIRRVLEKERETLAGLVPGNPKMKTARPAAERIPSQFSNLHLLVKETSKRSPGFWSNNLRCSDAASYDSWVYPLKSMT
jgi:hypothetical protein